MKLLKAGSGSIGRLHGSNLYALGGTGILLTCRKNVLEKGI